MSKALKQTLSQAIQGMEYDYTCLERSLQNPTNLQIGTLGTLYMSLDELRSIIIMLPSIGCTIGSIIRCEIFDHLSTISCYTQFLQYKCADELKADSHAYLQNILASVDCINEALH
jgi:hypothetical protein